MIERLNWRPIEPPSGLILHDRSLYERDGKHWVRLPARLRIDSVTHLHSEDAGGISIFAGR